MTPNTDSNELKTQLKEIQDRLASTAHLGQALQSAEMELSQHIKQLEAGDVSSQLGEATEALQSKLSKIQQMYSGLMTKQSNAKALNKREDTHGRLASSKRYKSQISQSHSSEDLSFASDLSEQFLVEARKMREELHNKDRQLEEQAIEREQLRNESKELQTIISGLKANQERIKDENWNLELRLQELDSKVSKSDVVVAKMSGKSRQLASQEEAHIDQIETLKLHANELKKELDQLKGKHESQTSNWRREKEELSQDNAVLHKTLIDLKQELAAASTVISSIDGEESSTGPTHSTEPSTDEEFETPTNSPPLSPVNQTPARMSILENETMKKSLQHTHRQIATLKTSFLKERSEKSELKRQIAQLQEELNKTKSMPNASSGSSGTSVVRTKRSKYFARQNAALRRAEASFGRAITSDSAQSSTESEAAFETAQEDAAMVTNTEDEVFQTVGEESSGAETETEGDRTATSSRFFNLDAAHESTASLSSGSDEEESNVYRFASTRRSVRMKRSSRQVNLSENREVSEPKSLADELHPIDDDEKQATSHATDIMSGIDDRLLVPEVFENPKVLTVDDIQQAARALDYTAIPMSEYNTLKSHEHNLHDPKTLTESVLPSLGFVAVSSEDYAKLVNPTKLDIENHAKKHDLKTLSIKDHEKLVHESTRPRTREEVEKLAKDHDLIAVPVEVHEHLKNLEENPTKESVQVLADKVDHKLVGKETYDNWNHPSVEFLSAQAASRGLTTIETSKYKDLNRALTSPSAEELSQKASKLGLQVLPVSEYRELTSPNKQQLQKMAETIHATIVDQADFESIKKLANSPPEEHLIRLAKKQGLVAVPEQQWLKTKMLADEPDEEHVKSKATAIGFAAVAASHLQKLEQKAHNPSLDEIEKHASSKKMLLISKGDHERFVNPSLEDLTKQSATHGHRLISKKSFNALKNPSQADLEAHARNMDMVVLKSADYDKMRTYQPNLQELEKHASELGQVVIAKDKFEKLSKDADIVIDKSFVASAAAGMGLSVIAHEELAKLKEPPTFERAVDIAKDNGHVVITSVQFEALQNPTVEQAKKICGANNLVVLSSSEHEKLIEPYEPKTSEEVESFAQKFGLVTVPEKDYVQLTAAPSREKVVEDSRNLGLVAIDKNVHDELISRPKEFKPSLDELQKHAVDHKHELVPVDRLQELQRPSKDRLVEVGKELGLEIVPSSEYEELRRKTSNPSSSELETLAAGLGLTVLPMKQVQDLHERISNPTKDHVKEAADKTGLAVLSASELDDLRKKAALPTLDQIRNISSSKYGHVVVAQSEHDELKRSVEEPTIEELRFRADKTGFVLVDKNTYDELEKNATDPDDATLSKFGKRKGLSVVPSTELEDLRKSAHHPTKEQIEHFAKKLNLSVIPVDQYAALFERDDSAKSIHGFDDYDGAHVNKPLSAQDTGGSMIGGSPKNIHLQSVAFKRSHFEDMIRKAGVPEEGKPVDKKIVESMRSLGYVPVAQEEYKRLLDNQQVYNPTKVEIMRAAKKFGLTAIAVEEYRSLLKRHSHRESSASFENMMDLKGTASPSSTVFSENASSSSKSPPGSPTKHSRRSSSDLEMQNVSVTYLNTLRRIAENPTKEDVELLARKAGVSLVDETKDTRATGEIQKPSIEKVKSDAALFGLIPLSVTEYENLLHREESPMTTENVIANARRLNIVPLSKEEYESLNERASKSDLNLSADEIKNHAKTAGLVTMTIEEYEQLNEVDPSKVESEAEKLDLVTVPKSVYENMQTMKAPLNEKELKDQAGLFGLMLVSEEELDKRVQEETEKAKAAEEKRLKEVKPVTSKSSESTTRDIAPVALQKSTSFEKMKQAIPELTKEDVYMHGRKLGLTVIETNDYRKQMEQQSTALAAAKSKSALIDKQDIEKHAALLGLTVLDNDEHKRLSNATLTGKESSTKETRRTSAMSPREISPPIFESPAEEYPLRNTQHSFAGDSIRNRASLGSVSTDSKYHTAIMAPNAELAHRPRRNASDDANGSLMNLSAVTIASQASLTDRNMIPYISQIVIGEFLHKYTRRIGVSGISDTRHERYFWVHPYSLTLHWGKENPGSAMRHDLKTRSAAIKAVKSVDDPNPLPPGLYHKSILITTNERQIKLTCPNRRRHNIWYNSLQYLIKRSMDDLTFEEDDIVDDYVEDRNMRAERARTASVLSHRTRTTTTGDRILSIRRSMAPEMNSPNSRSMSMRSSGVPLDVMNSRPGTALSYRPPSLLPPNAV